MSRSLRGRGGLSNVCLMSVQCLCIDCLKSVYIISLEKFLVVMGGWFYDYSFSSGPFQSGLEISPRE